MILPDGYALFVRDDPQYRLLYGNGKFIAGQYRGALALGKQLAPAGEPLGGDRKLGLRVHGRNQLPVRGRRAPEQEIVELDHMAVGVDDRAMGSVGHGGVSISKPGPEAVRRTGAGRYHHAARNARSRSHNAAI